VPLETEEIINTLADQGFKTLSATSVPGLLGLLKFDRPDVVIVDGALLDEHEDLIMLLRSMSFGVRTFALVGSDAQPTDIVRLMKRGAASVFARPYQYTEMLRAIVDELRTDLRGSGDAVTVQGMASLTDRERDVLNHILGGRTNKETAVTLGISSRTIEVHRARIMEKLGARNTVELVKTALQLK
jgi:two-component system response regulator DctR